MSGIKTFHERHPRITLTLLAILCGVVGVGAYLSTPAPGSPTSGPSTGPSVTQPTVQVPTQPTLPSNTTSSPGSASPSPTSTQSGGEDSDSTDDPSTPTSPSPSATSTRSPGAKDDARAKELLAAVVPKWAQMDLTKTYDAETWANTWDSNEGVTNAFLGYSKDQFIAMFGGAMQSSVSLLDAKIVKQERLWNTGDRSLWRVTIERKVVRLEDGVTTNTETVTWDFLIDQDDMASSLVTFSEPSDLATDPGTYVPPR